MVAVTSLVLADIVTENTFMGVAPSELAPGMQQRRFSEPAWFCCAAVESVDVLGAEKKRRSRRGKNTKQQWLETSEPNCEDGRVAEAKAQDGPTTLIVRNVPKTYGSAQLMETLNKTGFAAVYDFLYLPVDFEADMNFGYVFVNFITHEVALEAQRHFNGFAGWSVANEGVASAEWSNPHQGLEAHVERFRNSPMMHPAVPSCYKPMVFKDGASVPFPEPTKRLRALNVRRFKAISQGVPETN